MSKVIFKLKFESPNRGGKTRQNNMYHLLYIGTREGVALNDDIKNLKENQFQKELNDWGNTKAIFKIDSILKDELGISVTRDYYQRSGVVTYKFCNSKLGKVSDFHSERDYKEFKDKKIGMREILKEVGLTDTEIDILKNGKGELANLIKKGDRLFGINERVIEFDKLNEKEKKLYDLVEKTKNPLEEINSQGSSNKDYLKYIANRPRSHGLFSSKNKEININELAKFMGEYEGYVYRGIVSLREDDAIEKGFDKKENWENLIRDKAFLMARQLNIPYKQLRWVGAFHRENGHPHVHLMIWNSEAEIRNIGVIPKDNIENIRKAFTNEIFSDEREQILNEKNLLRDILTENTKGVGIEFNPSEKLIELEEKYIEVNKELFELEETNTFDIGNKIKNYMINDIGEMIRNLEVPKEGRLQYKLMPPEIKAEVDNITTEIFKYPIFEKALEDYLNSVENLTKLYTDKEEDIKMAIDNAKDDIYKRIGNNILKSKKSMQYNNKNNEAIKSPYVCQKLLMNIIEDITRKTYNQNNKTNIVMDRSKAQKIEYAKKHKAEGLYQGED